MGIKKQFETMKENWLVIVLVLVVLIFISGGNGIVGTSFDSLKGGSRNLGVTYDGVASSQEMYYPGGSVDNFAPEVEERKITRTSSLSSEVERGEFREAEERLKNIITSSDAYLLNERVNRNGEGWRGYYYGYYSIKVDTDKYSSVVAQLKEIGEVQDFNENMVDVTGRYDDISIEIETEKARLERYLEMYEEAKDVKDKIELSDRIFNQERTIKYLENSLENIDNRIDYSSISFSMSEERSEWTNIVFVKLSSLARDFVDSVNALLSFLFGVIPWAIAIGIVWFFWKRFKN
jgi:hypothetical protein